MNCNIFEKCHNKRPAPTITKTKNHQKNIKIKVPKITYYGKLLLISIIITNWFLPLNARKNVSVYIISPSLSKHLKTSYKNFREFHPGFGAEFQYNFNRFLLGWHGYYMSKDSLNHESFWTGLTLGYQWGKTNKFWFSPFVIAGGIKKNEYHAGKFSFFALPILSAGYKFMGFNLAYIPEIINVTNPLLIFQVKLRL